MVTRGEIRVGTRSGMRDSRAHYSARSRATHRAAHNQAHSSAHHPTARPTSCAKTSGAQRNSVAMEQMSQIAVDARGSKARNFSAHGLAESSADAAILMDEARLHSFNHRIAMNNYDLLKLHANRRTFLGRSLLGLGGVALGSLIDRVRGAETKFQSKGVVNPLHWAPKVKRVIFLTMAGGPSHLETFDYRPKLAEMSGKPMPESFTKGQPIAQLQGAKLNCLAPQHEFKKVGKNGQEISSIFPFIHKIADDICIVRSMRTEAINHDPAHTFMNTGTTISGRPSMGSWAWYGLGSESDNLPGFVVLTSTGKSGQSQPIASRQWSAGFLPSRYQGVHFRSKGDPVLYVGNPAGVSQNQQKDVIDAAGRLNKLFEDQVDDPEIATRIAQYEMAFRMQTSVPELMDMSKEDAKTLELYGTKGGVGGCAAKCFLARRLAERGVRFIQLYHRDWDHHGGIKNDIPVVAKEVDQAC